MCGCDHLAYILQIASSSVVDKTFKAVLDAAIWNDIYVKGFGERDKEHCS